MTVDFVHLTSDSVVVHLGNGDGAFSSQPFFYAGQDDYRIIAADFDRNGTADLAILANLSEAVLTYSGNGDGTFGPARISPLQNALLNGAAVADFNADGRPDLVVGDLTTDDVSVLLGNGDGTFGPEIRYPGGVSPWAVTTADFNRDGRVDIAVASANWRDIPPSPIPAGTLSIILGNGDGTFQLPISYEVGVDPMGVYPADFNGDGTLDIIVLNGLGGYGVTSEASMFLGAGDGTFVPSAPVTVGEFASGFSVKDFDGDGRLDLAVANRGHYMDVYPYEHVDGNLSIFGGNGDGTFKAGLLIASIYSASSVAAADLNGDNRLDFTLIDEGDLGPDHRGGVQVLLGQANGTYLPGEFYVAGVGPLDVRIGDFDGSGTQDLALANNGGDESILLGHGDGTFDSELRFGLFGNPIFLASEDFNGDGSVDLLIVSSGGVYLLEGRAGTRIHVLNLALSLENPRARRSGTLTWSTDHERDISGFNVIQLLGPAGRRVQINSGPIACVECDTGIGHDYSYRVPNVRSGRDIFLEVLYQNGSVETFGPTSLPGLGPGSGGVGPINRPGLLTDIPPRDGGHPGGRGSPAR